MKECRQRARGLQLSEGKPSGVPTEHTADMSEGFLLDQKCQKCTILRVAVRKGWWGWWWRPIPLVFSFSWGKDSDLGPNSQACSINSLKK